MDTYSNILYVKEARGILSVLAHNAVKVNKVQFHQFHNLFFQSNINIFLLQFCPETCCIIGNYYSMKSEHEKVVSLLANDQHRPQQHKPVCV